MNKEYQKPNPRHIPEPFMDNPEHLKTEDVSIYDMHEDMKYVDEIPLEDLKMELREEKVHHDGKSRSSSEDKYEN